MKKYLYISLAFNGVVILTFIFFSFLYPHLSGAKRTSAQKAGENLSQDQQQLVDSLSAYYRQLENPLRLRNIENRLRLWELLMADSLDSLQINRVMEELMKGEDAQRAVRYEHSLRENQVLTVEQRRARLQTAYERLKAYLENLQQSGTGH